MRFDFLSTSARQVVVAAQRLARSRGEEQVELEHLLACLCENAQAAAVLKAAGADPSKLAQSLAPLMAGFPKVSAPQVYLGEGVLRVFDLAQADAGERSGGLIEPTHLLLAIPLEPTSKAAQVLKDAGATLDKLERAVSANTAVADSPGGGADGASNTPLLARFARDLTAQAAKGELDAVVGRDKELRRLLQILGRHTKNNPVLIGEPGVGKTAIVEGLAQRIADGDVPPRLARKRILTLDVGGLVAGARFRGDFEDRVRGIVAEARDSGGDVLLFFDELHSLVGAGKGGGSLDAASLLKPALARGEISIIGATTPDEYRQSIETDPAFERRFAPIHIDEPDDARCLAMLRAQKPQYEQRHEITITDEALEAAVKLSRRYVSGRALPDKAFDLLDEAASRLRLEIDGHPDELDAMARKATAAELELAALPKDGGAQTETARARLQSEREAARTELERLRGVLELQKAAIENLRRAATAKDAAQDEATRAEKRGDLELASRLRYGELPKLQQAWQQAREGLADAQKNGALLEDAVGPVHVARVVEDWTGIPVARALEGEGDKILNIEDRLQARVVGQSEAVRLVGNAIKRSRAGLSDPNRPIGSFLFLGPTGVGKTELAKALAEFLFDDEHALVRLDMSEYMEKHSVARLTGAPPGYVGYEEGGQLTEAVRHRPYAVVLLDEIEKAHPDVFNVLLALLDDGRLTDSAGRTVGFSNVVLIMTSNLGASAILDVAASVGDEAQKRAAMTDAVQAALRGHFRPEFLNRIDDVVIFNPLGTSAIEAIVDLQFKQVGKLLAERSLSLKLSSEARAWLATTAYDPAFGARPVKRTIGRFVRDPLSQAILRGEFVRGDVIEVRLVGNALTFAKA
ncbi:MAG: AAA family ATPase [Deltaproteobacteria bacterium]|nr:AAA family ATPase [Deltaproteobacteria bacterium]